MLPLPQTLPFFGLLCALDSFGGAASSDLAAGEFLEAIIDTQPNTQLVRDALLRGETVNGAKLERRSHIRID